MNRTLNNPEGFTEDEIIDCEWEWVKEKVIKPHHIVNSIILIVIVLYLSSLGMANALTYIFMELTGG